jgi:ubiquinone biosynthesis protein Coq4
MKRALLYLQLFYYLIRLVRSPEDTPAVLKVPPILIRLGFTNGPLKAIAPHEKELDASNYYLKPFDLEKLKLLPEDTLGHAYATHMISNKLDPHFFGRKVDVGDASRYLFRVRQTHDLWHVVTGFSTKVEDDLGLQAFLYAQVRSPLAPVLIGAAILRAGLRNYPNTFQIIDRIFQGWEMGKAAKNLYPIKWDDEWATPLAELRSKYNIIQAQKL